MECHFIRSSCLSRYDCSEEIPIWFDVSGDEQCSVERIGFE